MKFLLLIMWAAITVLSAAVMLAMIKDIKNVFDAIQTGAICFIWSSLIIISGRYILSCLKSNQ